MVETGSYTFPATGPEHKYVRVSGPQVGLNKADKGDRPSMYLFFDGEEWMGHEVIFHNTVRLVQNYDKGCPATGAVLWLETYGELTLIVREDHDLHAHVRAKRAGTLDDVERK